MITVENRRFALMTALGVVLFLMYQTWQKEHPPAAPPEAATAPVPAEAPALDAESDVPKASAPGAPTAPAAVEAPAAPAKVTVETDRFHVELSTQGGDVRRVVLKGYAVAKQHPDVDVALLDDAPARWFVVQSGLAGVAAPLASHKDLFRAAGERYVLADGADTLDVALELRGAGGERVVKTYRFHRGSYVIGLTQHVENGAQAVTVSPYVQLWRVPFSVGEEPPFIPATMDVGYYEQKDEKAYRFRKTPLEDLADEPVQVKQTGGWIAFLQHYFFAAVIAPQGEGATFAAKPSSTRGYLAQYLGAPREIAAGATADFTAQLYVGPTLQTGFAPQPDSRSTWAKLFSLDGLEHVAPGLELTVDYGILTPVAEPLFWLLDWFHKLTRNWGAAIILLTVAVKLALFKLSEAQYRSMAKMKKYAPRIQELKERYADDRQRMNQAMMELYKKEKFNPLAGCWPLLIQMPIFIALYWVLLQSVELRQADFALWVNDLSAADPYFVLPVLFGITMFVQQKLSGNVVMDPMQQRVMQVMPVMMTVFFAFFPAGLVLYWLVSNLIGIAQQWVITRRLDREAPR